VKLWIDAQISPALANWLRTELGVEAVALRDLGLRDAADAVIWRSARAADVVIVTKDSDFSDLLARHGPPPRVVWVRAGNTSNAALQRAFHAKWVEIERLFDAGEALVELRH
jgi:predicted nuclease of predicted toxin-antitoxin system